MIDVEWQDTSREVYAVLWARHSEDLHVVASETDTHGEHHSEPLPYMMTQWGFKRGTTPLMKSVRRGSSYSYYLAVLLPCEED